MSYFVSVYHNNEKVSSSFVCNVSSAEKAVGFTKERMKKFGTPGGADPNDLEFKAIEGR